MSNKPAETKDATKTGEPKEKEQEQTPPVETEKDKAPKAPPKEKQNPPPPPEKAKKVRVLTEGTLGPKLLKKGDITNDPDYVALLEVRGQKKVEEVK